jgi:hypothetical protein
MMNDEFGGVAVQPQAAGQTGQPARDEFGGMPVQAGGAGASASQPPQSQPRTFGDHLLSAAKNFWQTVNPMGIAQGMAGAAEHPLDTVRGIGNRNAELFKKAEDAYKSGDYVGAISHGLNYLLNGIPGVGSTLDDAGEQAKAGDVGGALGKTAGLAALMIGTPKIPEVAGNVADIAPRVGRAAAAGVKAAAPDVMAGGAQVAGGELIGKIPGMEWPSRFVFGWPGARQIARGLKAGISAGREAFSAAPGVAGAGAEAASELDDWAQALAGKNFDKLTESQQGTIRDMAARSEARESAAPAPASPPASAAAAPAVSAESPVDTSAVPVNGAPAATNTAAASTPRVRIIPFSEPDADPETFAGPARAAKAHVIAKFLHSGGISAEDMADPSVTENHWQMAAQGAGQKPIQNIDATRGLVLKELRRLELSENTSPEMKARLEQTHALPAAEDLRDSIAEGDMVRLKNGKTVTVKKVNGDGTFEH